MRTFRVMCGMAWRAVGRVAVLGVLAAATPAQSDTLVGPLGERLPGRVVSQESGRIVFESDSFGRLDVSAAQARVEPGPGTVSPATTPASSQADHAAWTADLSVKIGVDRGTTRSVEDDVDATLMLERASPRGDLHATVDYGYKQTDGVLKNDDLFLSLSYDRLPPGSHFVAWRMLGSREYAPEGADETHSVSAAYGWRLWERADRYLRLGPAIGYLDLQRGGTHFSGAAAGLYARGKWPSWGGMKLTGELQWLDSLDDGRHASLELRLRRPLGERLYVALAWKYEWSDVSVESGHSSEWRWMLGWRSRAEP